MSKVFFLSLLLVLYAHGQAPECWITVLVHGTVGIQSNMCFRTFWQVLKDKIENSHYERNICHMRENSCLFDAQAMQQRGLKKVCYGDNYPAGPQAFATLFDTILKQSNTLNGHTYYTYGWSGLLSHKRRFEESFEFYLALKKLIHDLKSTGVTPKIRLVGYSHGGTLCLNLGAIKNHSFMHDTFVVDEVILLGMPVQKKTRHLIYSSLFKHIYHIYSQGDTIQKLDFSGRCSLVSKRRFYNCCSDQLPLNFTQVELKVTASACRFLSKRKSARSRTMLNRSPGHFELWFFGWTSSNYRRSFPLYPLPMAVFIPTIIHSIETYKPHERSLIMDIRIDQKMATLQTHRKKLRTCFHFMDYNELEKLQACALEFQSRMLSNK